MLADNYPDLACRMHIQIRLMGNFGLNGGVPWHVGKNGSLCKCLICKEGTEDVTHFLFDCPFFKENVDFVWPRYYLGMAQYQNQNYGDKPP